MNYTCLIVEDENLIRHNLVRKISQSNSSFLHVLEASDGQEAVELLNHHHIDAIMTDIKMPAMDGLALSEYISKFHKDIPVVIISGYNEFSYAQQALRYGVYDYLLKPVSSELLTETLLSLQVSLDTKRASVQNSQISSLSANNGLTQDQLARLIQNYICSNYRSDITMESLAEYFHFSESYIGKIFKKQTGQTPVQYCIHLKINEARQLLIQHPEMSVSEVGKAVGYGDIYYFSRIFKKQTGFYPTEYIASNTFQK